VLVRGAGNLDGRALFFVAHGARRECPRVHVDISEIRASARKYAAQKDG
jgi:hypothetical protein